MRFVQTQSPEERFLAKLNTTGKTVSHVLGIGPCWDWIGYVNHRNGRGQFWIGGKLTSAHRAAWMIFRGKIPNGSCVLHRCDNPVCCNPHHLFLGTQQDNITDAQFKGRLVSPPGERCGGSRLLESQVIEIVRMLDIKLSHAEIGKRFGVTKSAVWSIARGRTWKHLAARDAQPKEGK